MTDLVYPSFPWRPLLAAGVTVLLLAAAAIALNARGPDLRGCAIAASRMMAARDYSLTMMHAIGERSVPACRGLGGSQFSQALLDAYVIEYRGKLPGTPELAGLPSPAFRARSARAALLAGPAARRAPAGRLPVRRRPRDDPARR